MDYIVHHEGEFTLVELLDTLRAKSRCGGLCCENIPGIAYRAITTGQVVVNPRRPYILNLDELPPPARDLIDVDHYLEVWREQNGYAS